MRQPYNGSFRCLQSVRVNPIPFPICGIIFDIQRNPFQFTVVADDVVVEPGLPCEWDALPLGLPDDSGFELSDDMGQTSATFGTTLHFRINVLFIVGVSQYVVVGLSHCGSPTIGVP